MANPIDDDLDHGAREAKSVHARVAKELVARIEAECDSDNDGGATAAVGWGMALADAIVALSAEAQVPMGLIVEMILRAYAEAVNEHDDKCDS